MLNNYLNTHTIVYILFYICICSIVLYVIVYSYIRIKHRFWSTQPVFHIYNIPYYWKENRIIYENGFSRNVSLKQKMNTYLDMLNIQTIPIETNYFKKSDNYKKTRQSQKEYTNNSDYFSIHMQQLYNLVSNHYLKTKENNYSPTMKSIVSYFTYHTSNCYIGYYMSYKPLFEFNNIIHSTKPISVITSRPLIYKVNMKLKNEIQSETKYATILDKLHYVDFLTTHTKYRKKNITPKLICSFAYQVETNENKSCVFLFKLEEKSIFSIVPFVSFHSYIFDVIDILKQTKQYLEYTFIQIEDNSISNCFNHHISKIEESNLGACIHTMEQIKVENYIHSSYSNIKELVSNNIVYIYCLHETLQKNSPIIGLLFFRNNFHYYKENDVKKNIFECFGSLFDTRYIVNDLFQQKVLFFIHSSLKQLKEIENVEYITFENLAHTNYIIDFFKTIHIECLHSYKSSYYFYNFIKHTISSNNVLFLM